MQDQAKTKNQGVEVKGIKTIFIGTLLLSSLISASVYAFSDAQLCQAGMATSDGHSAKAVKVISSKKGLVDVSYLRPEDKKHFKYRCKITPSEVLWMDEYSGGKWSKNTRIFYKVLAKNKLEIRVTFSGELPENSQDADIRLFSNKDF